MSAIESLAAHLPGVPEHLKGLPGIKPDPNRLFMAGEFAATLRAMCMYNERGNIGKDTEDMFLSYYGRIYIGHSNGGQGAWYLATHFPDKAIAGMIFL